MAGLVSWCSRMSVELWNVIPATAGDYEEWRYGRRLQGMISNCMAIACGHNIHGRLRDKSLRTATVPTGYVMFIGAYCIPNWMAIEILCIELVLGARRMGEMG